MCARPRPDAGTEPTLSSVRDLTLIYNTLSNDWVFADFNNFELAE